MTRAQKAFTTIMSANLALVGLVDQSFAQNFEKQNATEVRKIEHTKLNIVVPNSFHHNGGSKPWNNCDQDTTSVKAVLPFSFASEVIITINEQIRREQQNSDENIMKRQKEMVESIKRKK